MRVPETGRFMTFMGIRVHYVTVLPEVPVKSRMLLLCSPLMTTFNWRKILPEISQLGCLAVMVDLPGFGLSDCQGIEPQDHDLQANILWGMLDEIDRELGSPMSLWHLAGHGSACGTLLRMVAQYPDSTRSLLLISPLLTRPEEARERIGLARRYNAVTGSEEAFAEWINGLAAHPLDDYVLARMRRPLLREGARENFLRMLRQITINGGESMGFCPALALWGARDPLLSGDTRGKLRRFLPDAEIHVLKSAGHFPMETHSNALRDYLRGWIRYNE